MAARTIFLIAFLAGAALVALFFLPWRSVRIARQEIATATGRQIAEGRVAQKAVGTATVTVESRPWAWGAIGGAGLVVAAAVAGAARLVRRRSAGGALLLASFVGGGAVLLTLTIRYLESPLSSTQATEAFWASVALFGLTALCGILVFVVSSSAPPRRARKGRS